MGVHTAHREIADAHCGEGGGAGRSTKFQKQLSCRGPPMAFGLLVSTCDVAPALCSAFAPAIAFESDINVKV